MAATEKTIEQFGVRLPPHAAEVERIGIPERGIALLSQRHRHHGCPDLADGWDVDEVCGESVMAPAR